MTANRDALRALRLGWACPVPDDMALPEFAVLLDALAEAGYEGIEAMYAAPYALDVAILQDMLRARGLRLIGLRSGGIVERRGLYLSAGDPVTRARAVAALVEAVEYAARFDNCRILLGLMQGRLDPGVALPDARSWIVDGLAQAATVAARHGIEIDLEPINRFMLGYNGTVADILAMLDRIQAPNVRLLMDTFHMNIEEQNVAAAAIRAGSRIGHVHLADNNRRPPGQGCLDFAGFLGVLRAAGYAGNLTVECDYVPDQVQAARAAARYLSGLECG